MRSVWLFAFLSVLLGLIIGGSGMWGVYTYMDLVEVGRETEISQVISYTRSSQAFIEVGGTRYSCSGGTYVGQVVVYDPADPSRCRSPGAVGGPNGLELLGITVGGALILIGVLGLAFEATMRQRNNDLLDLVKQGRLPAPAMDAGADLPLGQGVAPRDREMER